MVVKLTGFPLAPPLYPPKLVFLFLLLPLLSPSSSSLASVLLQFLLPLHSDLCHISLLLSALPLRYRIKTLTLLLNSPPPPTMHWDPWRWGDRALPGLQWTLCCPHLIHSSSADGNLTKLALKTRYSFTDFLATTRILLIFFCRAWLNVWVPYNS